MAGRGNDTLIGSTDSNTYIFGRGYGFDNVFDAGGTDTLKFNADVVPSDLALARGGNGWNDLTLSIIGTSDQIVIHNMFVVPFFGREGAMESIQFCRWNGLEPAGRHKHADDCYCWRRCALRNRRCRHASGWRGERHA